ncbi:MAG: hypothetical protein DRI44_04230 [Chlamydiae bacterium]|nr:MAG: hypothetical protein DRI44_04230 [Chlamydiota bacterium]
MDKNSITAIVLTFLLVFLYMHFYGPKPQPAQQISSTNSVVQTESALSPATNALGSATKSSKKAVNSIANLSKITENLTETILSNNLVTFTFSSFGGDIEKINVHRNSKVKKGPIVTINAASNAWEVPLRIREFGKLNINNLILNPEFIGKSDIIFTGTIDKTIFVRKSYKLEANSYLLQAGMTFSNLTSSAVSISNSFSVWLGRINKVSSKADRYTKPRSIDVCTLNDGKLKLKRLKPSKKKTLQIADGPIEWLAVKDKYFTHILIPKKDALAVGANTINYKKEKQISGYANFNLPTIQSGGITSWSSTLYAGPTDYDNLKVLSTTVGRGGKYEEILNLGMFSFLAKPILVYGLKGLYKYVHNYGWAIIIITVIIKLITWPLQTKSFTSMQKMQKVQPELKALQEKYKDDKTKLQQEMMLLYRKHGVNPMGGCLPMLLQMPIFFALFAALSRSIELWGAPFLWIKDLSLPDNVATLPFSIPFLGDGVNPLAIVMGAAMIGQQALMPSTGDKSQKRMMYLMPVVMMVFFYKAPSGLVLYWLLNQIITMGQMFYLHYLKKS